VVGEVNDSAASAEQGHLQHDQTGARRALLSPHAGVAHVVHVMRKKTLRRAPGWTSSHRLLCARWSESQEDCAATIIGAMPLALADHRHSGKRAPGAAQPRCWNERIREAEPQITANHVLKCTAAGPPENATAGITRVTVQVRVVPSVFFL